MDYGLTETQQEIVNTARQVAEKKIKPVREHYDQTEEFPWPIVDRALLSDLEITLPVQVNGKKRADLTIAKDSDNAAIEKAALALDAVMRATEGKPVKKFIVVPGRIVNVVV